jgi:sugar O-acyltransferase (sialic acid O-acetyltransferase NeuD family)
VSGWEVLGFADDAFPAPVVNLPLPLLGGRAWLQRNSPDDFWVALGVGDNHARKALSEFLSACGFQVTTVVSRHAVVSPSASLGSGTVVMPGSVINAGALIGAGVIVNTGAVIEHDVVLGDYSHISPHAALGGGVQVGELAHVGLGASVIHCIQIGNRSIIGAGAVVTRAIADDVVAYGVPARVVYSTTPAACSGEKS